MFKISLACGWFMACGVVGGYYLPHPNLKTNVCTVTAVKPGFVAMVDPSTGHLFAVPTLQTVCVEVDKNK